MAITCNELRRKQVDASAACISKVKPVCTPTAGGDTGQGGLCFLVSPFPYCTIYTNICLVPHKLGGVHLLYSTLTWYAGIQWHKTMCIHHYPPKILVCYLKLRNYEYWLTYCPRCCLYEQQKTTNQDLIPLGDVKRQKWAWQIDT